MQAASRIAKFLGTVFFLLLLVCAVVIWFMRQSGDGKLHQLMIVKSGSMEPAIKTGSLLWVQHQSEYGVGDVITFAEDMETQRFITHRITGIERLPNDVAYRTKGDANEAEDTAMVLASSVLGKVRVAVPYVGYWFSYLQTPMGVTLFMVIPGTILVYEEVRKLRANVHRLKEATIPAAMALLVVSAVTGVGSTTAAYITQAKLSNVSFTFGEWAAPQLSVVQEDNAVLLSINNTQGYDEARFKVQYQHVVEGQTITEQSEVTTTKNTDEAVVTAPEVYLGTCSGDDCTPHQNVSNLTIEATLLKTGTVLRTLNYP